MLSELCGVALDDNGVAHEMPTEVKGGKIIFTTDHFSRYAIIGIEAPDKLRTSEPGSLLIKIMLGTAAIAACAAIPTFADRKKRRKTVPPASDGIAAARLSGRQDKTSPATGLLPGTFVMRDSKRERRTGK